MPATTTKGGNLTPGSVVLETSDLTKHFGDLVAVDSVDLRVRQGEFKSVIGPNGAGKTTLFNLITGSMQPTRGSVTLNDRDLTGLSPHERILQGIARSFQITNVFPGLTVRENVRLAAQAVRYGDIGASSVFFRSTTAFAEINEHTDQILERIDLTDRADEHAATLAYGDQRRLEMGLVLATDPEIVLLDEPTAGMSGEETGTAMELIDDVLAEKTLVLVEHDIDLVMEYSDTITVLHQGQIIADGTPQEISEDDAVQQAYLGGHA